MKNTVRIIIAALVAFCLCSCGKSFQDIKMTSCELVSLSPRGLSAIDATVSVGIDNPTVQVTLSQIYGLVKMNGEPCLHITADDVTLAPKTEDIYTLDLHGNIDSYFNPLQLLTLFSEPDWSVMTMDIRFRGTLKSGLGKDFEYKDIPLKDLLEKI